MLVRTDAGSSPHFGPTVGHDLGQPGGAGVVLGQALDHVPQRHEPGSCEDTRLAHAATQALALQARLGDQVLGPGQQ